MPELEIIIGVSVALGWTAFVQPAKLYSRIMCGRYSAAGTLDEFAKLIGFICRVPFFAPRYNIAPRQQAPVIVLENGEPTMKLMRCGPVCQSFILCHTIPKPFAPLWFGTVIHLAKPNWWKW
jgi:hypothetical protein